MEAPITTGRAQQSCPADATPLCRLRHLCHTRKLSGHLANPAEGYSQKDSRRFWRIGESFIGCIPPKDSLQLATRLGPGFEPVVQ